ncbi:hypothetical protein BTUL_0160g00270 [Botrytis tulipae]|uniref:Uncharacterized protein n=1 Tax=Botrytis tulipae TaxID=87230 RepID=A0A4Z1EDP7_9HELO|nr:hypothetical protein BTUL_0160g00270 [Botrytis tulipae]
MIPPSLVPTWIALKTVNAQWTILGNSLIPIRLDPLPVSRKRKSQGRRYEATRTSREAGSLHGDSIIAMYFPIIRDIRRYSAHPLYTSKPDWLSTYLLPYVSSNVVTIPYGDFPGYQLP